MRNIILTVITIFTITACTPADQQYCDGFGVEGMPEYGKCLGYYHTQEQLFATDRAVCEDNADQTYPRSLYDHGHMEQVMAPPAYWGTPYYGSTIIDVSPDYQHNAQVDQLRMRIIAPCMQTRGWNSATSWQAGRHPVTPAGKMRHKAAAGNALPWLK